MQHTDHGHTHNRTLFSFIIAGVISSLQEQASKAEQIPNVYVDWAACLPKDTDRLPNQPIQIRYHDPEEEIALGKFLKGLLSRTACGVLYDLVSVSLVIPFITLVVTILMFCYVPQHFHLRFLYSIL